MWPKKEGFGSYNLGGVDDFILCEGSRSNVVPQNICSSRPSELFSMWTNNSSRCGTRVFAVKVRISRRRGPGRGWPINPMTCPSDGERPGVDVDGTRERRRRWWHSGHHDVREPPGTSREAASRHSPEPSGWIRPGTPQCGTSGLQNRDRRVLFHRAWGNPSPVRCGRGTGTHGRRWVEP